MLKIYKNLVLIRIFNDPKKDFDILAINTQILTRMLESLERFRLDISVSIFNYF